MDFTAQDITKTAPIPPDDKVESALRFVRKNHEDLQEHILFHAGYLHSETEYIHVFEHYLALLRATVRLGKVLDSIGSERGF